MGMNIEGVGYLAMPASGSGPGVIVLQEWWGLVPHIKNVCDRFAQAGYVALAPDLYHGEATTSPDEAERQMMTLNIEQTAKELQTAARFLQENDAVTTEKLGVVGFCMGGQLALLAATVNSNIGAVVNFYGIHPKVRPDFSKLTAPVLGIFGDQDDFVTLEAVQQLESEIQAVGGSIQVNVYANASHAFFNDTRPEAYQAEAAADAWQKTLTFLNQNLAVA